MFHKNCKLKRVGSGVKSLTDILSRIIMVSFSLSSRRAETGEREREKQPGRRKDRQTDRITDRRND